MMTQTETTARNNKDRKNDKMNIFLSRCLRRATRTHFHALALAFVLASASVCLAVIPEPQNILYGTITLDNSPVTAAMTNVIVEAFRATNGPAVASYRMGSDPQVGNYYSLGVPVESVAPITDTNSSQVGDNLIIRLYDASGLRSQTNFTIVERGSVLRLDFGATVADSDGDGLPDAWELRWFGNLSKGPHDIAANGQTVLFNFIAGTDPTDPYATWKLNINLTNGLKRVWFLAAAASGPGYDGLTRLYGLQYRPALNTGAWADVAGYTNLVGSNQIVSYFPPGPGPLGFYRCRFALLGYTPPPVTPLPPVDSDGDGLPDAWEVLHFGTLDHDASYVCSNGRTALQNYIAGTDPNSPGSAFKLAIAPNNGQPWVSFTALRAQGVGYDGKTRFYTLESSTSPVVPFVAVAGFSNILAADQVVNLPTGSGPARFFRARASLQGPE
jgi:hypothetical protein